GGGRGGVGGGGVRWRGRAVVGGVRAGGVGGGVVRGVGAGGGGVGREGMGASGRYDGPMGKSDRAFVFGALGFFVGLGVPTGAWLDWLLTVVMLLALYTIINRARRGLQELAP